MSTPFDNELMISKYMSNSTETVPSHAKSPNVEEAIKWAERENKTIIIPTEDLADLEKQWDEFNQMHKKLRRESDWVSIELFGKTNEERYNEIKSSILRNAKIPNPFDNDYIPPIQASEDPIVSESYIDDISLHDYDKAVDIIKYSTLDVENAKEWMKRSGKIIIVPTRTLAELENLWDAYGIMIKKHKRESDWASADFFGCTNLRHYEYLKSQFLKDDIKPEDRAFYGALVEGTMIRDTQDIVKRYMCRCFLDGEISVTESVKTLIEMSSYGNGLYDNELSDTIISDVIDNELIDCPPVTYVNHGDMPYIEPQEMIDMGVFNTNPELNMYGVIAGNQIFSDTMTVKEWFEFYKASSEGKYANLGTFASDWVANVRRLSHGLKRLKESNSTDDLRIRSLKQSLLELGWDPEMEFTDENRVLVNTIHRMKQSNSMSYSRVVDLREFNVSSSSKNSYEDIESAGDLKPVYIVLTEGNTALSTTIKAFTHEIYSHSSIAFDSSLRKMYSYGVKGSVKGLRGGFIEEDVYKTPIGCRIGVYVFFVPDHVYNKLKLFVEDLKENVNRTTYSYKNLITYLFNIPYNQDWSLICSQFVDKLLKFADIDITNRDSSLVSPADLKKVVKKNRKIYTLYEGLASSYDGSKIHNMVMAMSKRVTPLKEYAVLFESCTSEYQYLKTLTEGITDIDVVIAAKSSVHLVHNPAVKRLLEDVLFESVTVTPYCEAKKFPVQFDKEGNLLIKNIKKLDYEEEYAKSHMLLREYLKSGNTEGMKYELSKLWMIQLIINKKLHSRKHQDSDNSAELKAKAKIVNDFKYFMKELLKIEPDFNFTEYFESSPFSSSATQIDGGTMKVIGSAIKAFVKPY